MGRVKKFQLNLKHHIREHPAQTFVEFALALPILLLLMFGIIEMGRLMQAWLALENGARFAVRYAITGQYDLTYCAEAGAALSTGTIDYAALDLQDGSADCIIPETYLTGPNFGDDITDYDLMTIELQDWARLPTIRDNALSGASGIAWDEAEPTSGSYLSYLDYAFDSSGDVLSQQYRGDPSEPGYFGISTCSNHADILSYFQLNPNPFWYDDVHTDENKFPIYCQEVDSNTNTVERFVDDAGGPGDRVRVTLTYRHDLITPFLSSWWPTLRLTSQREGLVEKFRTSRVTGLTGGISMAATLSFTPSHTFTPSLTVQATVTETPTATLVPTETLTFTPSPTQALCGEPDSILREYWTGISGSNVSDLLNAANYPYYPNGSDYPTNYQGPTNWGDYYGARYRGYICAPYEGDYTFYIVSSQKSNLYLSSDTDPAKKNLVAYVSDSARPLRWDDGDVISLGSVHLEAGQEYYTEALHKRDYHDWHDDNLAVGWVGPNDLSSANPIVITSKYLRPYIPEALPTPKTCANTGGLLRQRWAEIGNSNYVAPVKTAFVSINPTMSVNYAPFDEDTNFDGFGERWAGYICPPFDGEYTFYISSDDHSELWLSTDEYRVNIGSSPIAWIYDWTTYQVYNKASSQKSVTKNLLGGKLYYVEAWWKEGGGGDNFSVAWDIPYYTQLTPTPIAGQYLVPVTPVDTFVPTSTPSPTNTPTRTNTVPSPTRTNTVPSPTRTNTVPTSTNTPIPPTATRTNTVPSPTRTNTVPTSTNTPIPPTATHTNTVPSPTHTNTVPTRTPTITETATNYVPPTITLTITTFGSG